MSGVVYFLSDGELIKVGYATTVADRIACLQTGNGRKIECICSTPATLKQERTLHGILPARMEGEWFRPSVKLLRLMRIVMSTPHENRDGIIADFIDYERGKKSRLRAVQRSTQERLVARLRRETVELVTDIVEEHGCQALATAVGLTDGAVRWWKTGKAMPSALAIARIGVHYPERVMDLHRPLGQPPLIARAERMGIAA